LLLYDLMLFLEFVQQHRGQLLILNGFDFAFALAPLLKSLETNE